jgi:hypothetical protein
MGILANWQIIGCTVVCWLYGFAHEKGPFRGMKKRAAGCCPQRHIALALAERAMAMESAEQIVEFLTEQTRPLMPELFGK